MRVCHKTNPNGVLSAKVAAWLSRPASLGKVEEGCEEYQAESLWRMDARRYLDEVSSILMFWLFLDNSGSDRDASGAASLMKGGSFGSGEGRKGALRYHHGHDL